MCAHTHMHRYPELLNIPTDPPILSSTGSVRKKEREQCQDREMERRREERTKGKRKNGKKRFSHENINFQSG